MRRAATIAPAALIVLVAAVGMAALPATAIAGEKQKINPVARSEKPGAVVDDALLRLSEVLGPESKGVGLNLSVTSPEGTGQTLGAFGYGGARHGAALWEQTH